MITCTRRIEFDAAHRIINHESKCKMLHGHRYALEASFAAENLDNLGRVIDFGEIRQLLGDWIDNNLDHNLKPPHLTDQEQIAEEKFKVYGAAVQIFQSNPTLDNQLKAVSAFDSFNEVYLKPENGGSHGQ